MKAILRVHVFHEWNCMRIIKIVVECETVNVHTSILLIMGSSAYCEHYSTLSKGCSNTCLASVRPPAV